MTTDADFKFEEATRANIALKMAITGVTGGGKSWTALALATYLLGGEQKTPSMTKRIAVIDTERNSASLYSKGKPWHFSTLALKSFEPENFVKAIQAAERAGFDCLIIDSLSHEWAGTGGALEQVDRTARGGNTFAAWGKVTPRHNELMDCIMGSPLHIIATMRSKMAYEQTEDRKVKKLGLAAIARDGTEYEFGVVGSMDVDNTMNIEKTRCEELNGKQFRKPGRELAAILRRWLDDGAEPAPPEFVDWNEIQSAGDFVIGAGPEKGHKISTLSVPALESYRGSLESGLEDASQAKHHPVIKTRLRAVYERLQAAGDVTPLGPAAKPATGHQDGSAGQSDAGA